MEAAAEHIVSLHCRVESHSMDQQTCSYHATSLPSTSAEAIPSLLQESSGALYEIGVADDGTLVGLDEEELGASLDVLRDLAANLGSDVTVTRKVYVRTITEEDVRKAEAKFDEHIRVRLRSRKRGKDKSAKVPDGGASEEPAKVDAASEAERFGIPKLGSKLYVAEALVKPRDGLFGMPADGNGRKGDAPTASNTEQLRISFTGPTNCGKSTLIGTLTTGEPDNGQGKNRLSVSRHRHELLSGVTSSVTWEIVGYKPGQPAADSDPEDGFFGTEPEDTASRVINYATGNISSWTDIHSVAEGGRVVFMSDSPGQTKYRRSLYRSLVGWAPHYAVLVISARDLEEHKNLDGTGDAILSEASHSYLELCLKLGLRMVVIFSKMDVANNQFRKVYKRVVNILRDWKRKSAGVNSSKSLQDAVKAISTDGSTVPLMFTSSVVEGQVSLLHELLMSLPVPAPPVAPRLEDAIRPLPGTSITGITEGINELVITAHGTDVEIRSDDIGEVGDADPGDAQLTTLFHVEEIYGLKPAISSSTGEVEDGGSIVSGHVRYGRVSIGDKLIVGPFPVGETIRPRSRSVTPTPTATPALQSSLYASSSNASGVLSRSAESGDERRYRTEQRKAPDGDDELEWRAVQVVSVRRLRLPVTTLFADEAGTLGIVSMDEAALPVPMALDGASRQPATNTIGAQEPTSSSSSIAPIPIGERSLSPDKKAVTFASPPSAQPEIPELRLRKGVAILNRPSGAAGPAWPEGYTAFTALLDDDAAAQSLVVGSDWIVYVASIRAVARIVYVDPRPPVWETAGGNGQGAKRTHSSGDMFGFESDEEDGAETSHTQELHESEEPRRYGFEFLTGVEWMELGAKVLVTRSGSERGPTGLDIFVGEVIQRIRRLQ